MPGLHKTSSSELNEQGMNSRMNRAFIDVIWSFFKDVYFLIKSVFSHTDGTSGLYDISWKLFTWKSISILDSVYIMRAFPHVIFGQT